MHVAWDVRGLRRCHLQCGSGQETLSYISGGALVWLPNLNSWAPSVRELLKPSGQLILNEEHPQMGCIEIEQGSIKIISDYFDRLPRLSTG